LQGFLPAEALILEVEVWGLGGRKAREIQFSYKKREDLFTAQRRKVTCHAKFIVRHVLMFTCKT
jgi:hypothetical protein